MRETVNPLLLQVLHRRRMLSAARWSAVAWIFFGGLHITVWWFAFEHTPADWPRGPLVTAVWPLLLVATGAFISLVVYTARWLLAPSDPRVYDWLDQEPARGPISPVDLEPAGSTNEVTEESEPTIIRARR
jgi:apolipoprotein N-acyltransferase